MRHVFDSTVFVQTLVMSLQESFVQVRPSSQLGPGAQDPFAWQRPQLAAVTSSQYAPTLADHDVALVAVLQNWHGFVGLAAPFA